MSNPTSCLSKDSSEVKPGCSELYPVGSELLQGWRLHSLLGQPGPCSALLLVERFLLMSRVNHSCFLCCRVAESLSCTLLLASLVSPQSVVQEEFILCQADSVQTSLQQTTVNQTTVWKGWFGVSSPFVEGLIFLPSAAEKGERSQVSQAMIFCLLLSLSQPPQKVAGIGMK